MKYFDSQLREFSDRKEIQPNIKSIDVLMPTLDEEVFLERCLNSIYKEIPVRKLIVCDGGSNDKTIEILKKFPRVELHIKPELKTTAKILEFLFSTVETKWFALMDAHLDLEDGWYDKMIQHQEESDILENSKRIMGYHFHVLDEIKLKNDSRFYSCCHLIKKEAIRKYHCDDDYMWRNTDIFFRQIIEKSGYKWKKIDDVYHIHNETERFPYSSDDDKNYRKYVFGGLKVEVIDEDKSKKWDIRTAKSFIKYLDPDLPALRSNSVDVFIVKNLEREWIVRYGPQWLERYDKAKSVFEEKQIELNKNRLKIGFLTLLRTIDPDLPALQGNEVNKELMKISRKWIENNAPLWLNRYDQTMK